MHYTVRWKIKSSLLQTYNESPISMLLLKSYSISNQAGGSSAY